MFGISRFTGWKAISKNGEEFTCNWKNFPNDSMTPTFYWDVRHDKKSIWRPIDGCQAYNLNFTVYILPNGTKATPIETQLCEKHNYAYTNTECCFKCIIECL